MKNHTRSLPILPAVFFALVGHSAQAAIIAPYASDANTLFLWNLDENAGSSTASAAVGGRNLISVNNASVLGNNADIPQVTTILGATGASGFGKAAQINPSGSDTTGLGLDFSNNGQLGYDANGFGTVDHLAASNLTGANGAFTFEALINLSSLSSGQIMSGESTSSSANNRLFQFTVTSTSLVFTNIDTITQTLTGTIPTTGDHAFAANQWFHVAATYNGLESTSDNLKLYWTRLDNSHTQANQILSSNMTVDLTGTGILGIGAEFRGTSSTNLNGLIDEVRISDIARGADGFMFAVPEPGGVSMVLLGAGFLLFQRKRREK